MGQACTRMWPGSVKLAPILSVLSSTSRHVHFVSTKLSCNGQSVIGDAKYSPSERSLSNISSTLGKQCVYRNFINSHGNNQAYCNILLYRHFHNQIWQKVTS